MFSAVISYSANSKSLSALEETATCAYYVLVDLVRLIAADDREIRVLA